MNTIFFILALIIVVLFIYTIGRTLYTHKGLIRLYKTDNFLIALSISFGILLVIIIFTILVALNATFWHLTL